MGGEPGAFTIAAPVGGWNARDALEGMAPTDAVELINWIPSSGFVIGRGGSKTVLDGLTGAVETLIPYDGETGSKILAAYDGNIANVTGFTSPTVLDSGFTSDRWQFGSFDNKLVLVNGADDPQVYNGSTLTPMTITSGPTGTDLVGVVNFKGRAFYWENNSQSMWYAAAGSFQGVLSEFPFATFTQRGGYIVQIVTWTRDSGDGVDDYCAFIFSTGECLIYQGDDPSQALQWSMVGRYQIGAPLGPRGHCRFASTEVLLTDDGFTTLDEAIQNARTEIVDTFGGKIVRAAKSAAKTFRSNFGWQAIYYAAGNLFLANIPISTTQSEQYVKNTNTGAWCRFRGWNAHCFAIYNDRLYFGTDDGIALADLATSDSQKAYSDDGQAIQYEATTAYQKFGQPGLKTQLTAARVVTNAFDPRALSLNAFADYRSKILPPVLDPIEQTQGQWDVSSWDEDYWAGDENDPENSQARPVLRPVVTFGFATALNIRYRSIVQRVAWYSTTFIFKQAGVN
jgi:hypothetical protein